MLWFAVVIFFAICVLVPLFFVALTPRADDFVSVLTSERWHIAMRNTAIACVCSTVLSVLIGYVYAYAVVRGDIFCKAFFSGIPILHLITPPFVGGLAFILLFGRQGFVTHTLLGLDISLYGFWGLLLAQVLCFFPIAYLICAQTLRGINPSFEQSARGMGASPAKIFCSVTLPLSFPGILSALLFIAVSVLSDFGNPMIVGGRFRVLATEIYTQLTGWLNAGTSAVLGLVLVVPSIVLFVLQNNVLKANTAKIATIGGKTSSAPRQKAGLAVRISLTIFCALITLAIAAQFFAIVAGAFQKLWGVNTAFTLNHLRAMGGYAGELRNSVCFALVSALLSTIIASFTAYVTHRTNMPLRRFLDVTAQLPSAVPGTLFGLALALASNALRFRQSGVLIVVAMTVGFLPFSYRILSSTFAQLKTTLDDGARSLGADRLRVLRTILVPLSTGGIFSSFIYDFVRGVGTLSAVIFLVSFNTPLASVRILNLAEQGDWGKSAALALILTCVTFMILGIGRYLELRFRKRIWSE
ncbi:MAG: iron ABC transporter permease [Treponema sp.]|nr:iron ABC transporter permease [Treponema sp.]